MAGPSEMIEIVIREVAFVGCVVHDQKKRREAPGNYR
jgi:hypothetical protein